MSQGRNQTNDEKRNMEKKQTWFKPDHIDGNAKEEEEDDKPGKGGRGDEGTALRLAVKMVQK